MLYLFSQYQILLCSYLSLSLSFFWTATCYFESECCCYSKSIRGINNLQLAGGALFSGTFCQHSLSLVAQMSLSALAVWAPSAARIPPNCPESRCRQQGDGDAQATENKAYK